MFSQVPGLIGERQSKYKKITLSQQIVYPVPSLRSKKMIHRSMRQDLATPCQDLHSKSFALCCQFLSRVPQPEDAHCLTNETTQLILPNDAPFVLPLCVEESGWSSNESASGVTNPRTWRSGRPEAAISTSRSRTPEFLSAITLGSTGSPCYRRRSFSG